MEMCYEGALIMPSSYAVMSEDEMTYVEGGITVSGVCTIIGTVIGVHGAGYKTGGIIATKCYYAGLTPKKYKKWKWSIRAFFCQPMIGGTLGAATVLGFENKFYSYFK